MTVFYPSKNLEGGQGNVLFHKQLQTDCLEKKKPTKNPPHPTSPPNFQNPQITKNLKPTALLGSFAWDDTQVGIQISKKLASDCPGNHVSLI